MELPDKCVVAAGPVADYPLLAEEALHVERVHEKRYRQFASGRHFARAATTRLAGLAAPIPRGDSGAPIWPQGLIGSISHSETVAAATVCNGTLRGIGIDVEDAQRLDKSKPRLLQKLFTERERARTWADPREGTLMFSGKEAAYKAIHPIEGKYIGLLEVEVEVDWQRRTFRIRYLGDHPALRLLDSGFGRFTFVEDQVVALFLIP